MERPSRLAAIAAAGLAAVFAFGACSDSSGDEPGQITRIDGPATVDEDDAGADQDGAPPPDPGSSGEINDGS